MERDGAICVIKVDNVAKKNAFSPEMEQLARQHLTRA